MAKYIASSPTGLTEVQGLVTSTGAADQFKIVSTNNAGLLDLSLMPSGIGPDTASVVASENLAAGDFVNIWNDTGTAKARKADANTSGKHAHGFVLAAVTSGDPATVYLEGTNTQITGATPGDLFLSATTAGGFASTPPNPGTAGQVVQRLGVATSANTISFEPAQPIILA